MKNKYLLKVILVLSIVFSSIIYASYNTNIQMTGDAYLRSPGDIRITGIELVGKSGDAYEEFVPKYTKNTTSLFSVLPSGTYIQYAITITNKSEEDYVISQIEEISHNENLTYEYDIELENDLIKGMTESVETTKIVTIKISNDSTTEQHETLVLEYIFEEPKYSASELTYSNSATSCKTAQCALDELATLLS